MKLLTIAIPTFNRASKAYAQAEGLLSQVANGAFGEDVEILVCDNASTDDTKTVLEPLLLESGQTYSCNPRNLGLVGNYCRCLELSQGLFTWVVGDDDEIHEGAVEKITTALKGSPQLNVLFLNLFQRNGLTGELDSRGFYPKQFCGRFYGEEAARWFLGSVNHSPWLWITGSVVRTAIANEALQHAGSLQNMAVPLMVPMFAASRGDWEVSEDPSVTMVVGTTSWSAKYYRRVYGLDIPRALRRLKKAGHDFEHVPQFRDVIRRRWKALLGDFWRRGFSTVADWWRL